MALRGRVPISRPKSVSCARFGHVLYVIQHRFKRYNKRLIMTSGRRGNGGSKTRLQNGCFWRTEKWGIFWSWVFETEGVRRHRLIMSGLMMRAQIGVQKSTGKIRGNWGCQKGVFLEGRRREWKSAFSDLSKCSGPWRVIQRDKFFITDSILKLRSLSKLAE